MAVGDAYNTAALYKTAFGITTTTQDTRIASVLLAVSRYIERRLDRFFNQDASVVERLYEQHSRRLLIDGRPALMLDDISTTTGLIVKQDENVDGSVAADTAWTLNTDFILWPYNADKGPEPQPWTALVVPSWSSKTFIDAARFSVTAKFGWAAVPSALAQAAIELAAIVMADSPRATTRIVEGVDATMSLSAGAQSIIDRLIESYGGKGLAFS